MPRSFARCLLIVVVALLPSCLVVTCGETRTFGTGSSEAGKSTSPDTARSGPAW